MNHYLNKSVLVLGMGETGLSALRWLTRQGAELAVADSREAPGNLAEVQREFAGLEIHLGAFDAALLTRFEMIVVSPGVALSETAIQSAIKAGVEVVGDVELFARAKPDKAKVIAITGSNGKTTVTTLVGEMCKQAGLKTVVAGNIGLPVLDTLEDETVDVFVLELSSFQLETTSSLHADAATVLNVTEDHLDRYAGMAEYAQAKARIFAGNGTQILNRDDAMSMAMQIKNRSVFTFGLDLPATQQFGLITDGTKTWLMNGADRLISTDEMQLAGLHNAANALAAIALCRAIDLPMASLLTTLRQFKGLPHRVEWVCEIDEVAFYDDSKGTNVGATCAAIAGLARKVVLIAGGDGKGQDFTPLADAVTANARAVVLIGRDAPLIGDALKEVEVPQYLAADLTEAVMIAKRVSKAGDAVLLSPACASFDMFRNYLHRAEVFRAAVTRLQEAELCKS